MTNLSWGRYSLAHDGGGNTDGLAVQLYIFYTYMYTFNNIIVMYSDCIKRRVYDMSLRMYKSR